METLAGTPKILRNKWPLHIKKDLIPPAPFDDNYKTQPQGLPQPLKLPFSSINILFPEFLNQHYCKLFNYLQHHI